MYFFYKFSQNLKKPAGKSREIGDQGSLIKEKINFDTVTEVVRFC